MRAVGRQRRWRRIRAAVTGFALAALLGTGVGAGGSAGAGVSVGSDGSTVTVAGSRVGGRSYLEVTARGPAAITCRDFVTIGGGTAEADGGGVSGGTAWPALDPTRTATWRYWLECRYPDGSLVGLADGGRGYVYADEIVDVDARARRFAEKYLATRVAPRLAVGTSPPGRTLVGVPTWFWVDGVAAAPVTETHDVVGHVLELQLAVSTVRWDFGDGTSAVSGPDGLGAAGRPDGAVHTYRRRSTGVGADAGWPVRVTVTVDVSYRLDGEGPHRVDPPLQASATAALVVREAQAVIRS